MTNNEPPTTVSNLEYWRRLATSADAGILDVPEEVARSCHLACEDYLATLKTAVRKAQALEYVGGMGTFPSGLQLAKKFSLKAVGGPLSLEEVLLQHITVIEGMQAFFQKFFTSIEGQDSDNAALIAGPER